MSFDSDLLDDILLQPSNAPERASGKFQPKVRRKNEKVVQQPISSNHPAQHGERVSIVNAAKEPSFTEGCTDVHRHPLCDSNSNVGLQRHEGNLAGQMDIFLPGSDTLDDMLPQLATTTDTVMEKCQPKVKSSASKLVPPPTSPTSMDESLSSGSNPPHCALHPFEGQEFIGKSQPEDHISDGDKELQTDSGLSNEMETRVLANVELLSENLCQTSEASDAPVVGAAASGADGDLLTDQWPSVGETPSASFDMGSVDKDISQPDATTSSEAIIPDHSVDLQVDGGKLQGEKGSDLYEDILLQPTLRAARNVGKFQPKLGAKIKKAKAIASDCFDMMQPARNSEAISPEIESHKSAVLHIPPDSSMSLERPTNGTLGENAKASALEAASPDNHGKLGSSHDTLEKDRIKSQKGKSKQDTFWETNDYHSQGTVDGGSSATVDFEVNDANQAVRRPKKRTSVCSVADELDDGNGEDWEAGADKSSGSQMAEESSDDEWAGKKSRKKRKPRKSKGSQDVKGSRTRKKTSCGSDLPTQEPQRKKFSHSTRRSKRQVDKVLLETPEEDIDPMRLRIKDLIVLAEARERIAVKEAATTGQSTRDQSDNSFYHSSSSLNDNQEQGLNVDGDEASPTVHFNSTKLNYHTYMTRSRPGRWSKVDTELFYQAVRQFGSDFEMIQQLFPNRTRHQIKLKFKNEERKHPLQIADALSHRSKDHSQFELLIQRLQAQEEENSNGDAADDNGIDNAQDESQTKTTEHEEEEHVEVDKKEEEEEVDNWDQAQDSANPNEDQDVFDWSQYEFNNPSSSYYMEKDEYNIF